MDELFIGVHDATVKGAVLPRRLAIGDWRLTISSVRRAQRWVRCVNRALPQDNLVSVSRP
jgi:hypothetical protein